MLKDSTICGRHRTQRERVIPAVAEVPQQQVQQQLKPRTSVRLGSQDALNASWIPAVWIQRWAAWRPFGGPMRPECSDLVADSGAEVAVVVGWMDDPCHATSCQSLRELCQPRASCWKPWTDSEGVDRKQPVPAVAVKRGRIRDRRHRALDVRSPRGSPWPAQLPSSLVQRRMRTRCLLSVRCVEMHIHRERSVVPHRG